MTHGPSGRAFSTKYAAAVFGSERDTIDEAYPGDVVGLVNAGNVEIGDSLYVGEPVSYPRIPRFAPELFAAARACAASRHKQFRRGLDQLEQEGVVLVLRDPDGDPTPILAAVGQMQFEVLAHRMEHEFGAQVQLSPMPHTLARRTDGPTADQLRRRGVPILVRRDDTLLALFDSPYWLQRLQSDHPEWCLEPVLADGTLP